MLALIDYGMGNLLSVSKALEAVGAEVVITSDKNILNNADHIVLPGVGNFGDGMEHLNSLGLAQIIKDWINMKKPFLGICLGMQLLMDSSEEAPGVPGLGVIKGKVLKFPSKISGSTTSQTLKIPHMGWNTVSITENGDKMFKNIKDNSFFYFVHSFYLAPEENSIASGLCEYGINFTAAIQINNIFATQFHPEKSQDKGMQILKNFLAAK